MWTDKMSWISSGIIGVLFIIYASYNGFIYLFFPKKYKGIVFTTKNITYITMLSACSVTITVIVSRIVPVTVLPPIRISFEGLMVKASGFIFGPIVGFISGIVTDSLCMLFIPSYFHVAYLISMGFYGFIAGLIGVLNRNCKDKKWIIFLISNLFVIGFISFMAYYTFQIQSLISIYHNIKLPSYIVTTILFITSGFILFFQFIIFFISLFLKLQKSKNSFFYNNHFFKRSTKKIKLIDFDGNIIAILFLAILTEYLISSLIIPWGDVSIVSPIKRSSNLSDGYLGIFLYRLIEAPIKIIVNTLIIYITWKSVSVLIKKD